jgi:hypothetical protein
LTVTIKSKVHYHTIAHRRVTRQRWRNKSLKTVITKHGPKTATEELYFSCGLCRDVISILDKADIPTGSNIWSQVPQGCSIPRHTNWLTDCQS